MGGGLANRYPNEQIAPRGAGTPMPTNIPEPLRVFRISDGAHLASAGGYAKALGTTAQLWLNLQNDYDVQIAKRNLGKILDRIESVNKPKAA
jgi:hypothetical protein